MVLHITVQSVIHIAIDVFNSGIAFSSFPNIMQPYADFFFSFWLNTNLLYLLLFSSLYLSCIFLLNFSLWFGAYLWYFDQHITEISRKPQETVSTLERKKKRHNTLPLKGYKTNMLLLVNTTSLRSALVSLSSRLKF